MFLTQGMVRGVSRSRWAQTGASPVSAHLHLPTLSVLCEPPCFKLCLNWINILVVQNLNCVVCLCLCPCLMNIDTALWDLMIKCGNTCWIQLKGEVQDFFQIATKFCFFAFVDAFIWYNVLIYYALHMFWTFLSIRYNLRKTWLKLRDIILAPFKKQNSFNN